MSLSRDNKGCSSAEEAERPEPQTKAALPVGNSPLRAIHFKKASATCRRAALKGPTFHRTGRSGLVESKTGSSLAPGKHAGEHFKTLKLLLTYSLLRNL